MKKRKIVILGSTGSIGESTLKVLDYQRSNFSIELLTANNNYKKLIQQAKKFKPKNILIMNTMFYEKVKNSLKNNKTKVYTGNISITKIIKGKIDYTMSAIVGVAGLQPTVDAIKISKIVALANKESIISGWEILSKFIKKYKTKILPVDSEHFSIMELTKNINDEEIEEIIITASGGPFLNFSKNKLNNVKPKQAIKHPNWKMGKKISVDSATMMNKVFEVIEAQRIFDIELKKFTILVHPNSYVHSIVKFNNGTTKILVHDTSMKIPIFNTLYQDSNKKLISKKLDIKKLNNLNFKKIDTKKFPVINILKQVSKKNSLFETVVVSANDLLVESFLDGKIKFMDISTYLRKIVNLKEFKKFKHILPSNVNQIIKLSKYVRLKTQSLSVISPKS